MLKDYLLCPVCGKPLWKYKNLGNSEILKCDCSEYPLVSGILYLKNDGVGKEAVECLINRKEEKALIALLNLRFLLFLPLYFLFISKPIAEFSMFFFKKPFYLFLGFENTIRIMTLFSFDKKWAWYLINRKKIPSYFLSLLTTNMVKKKGDKGADLGCGVGHLLPELESVVTPGNVYGLDSSFLNLFLARTFFANPRTLLICCDMEKGFPFKDSSLNLTTVTDTFNQIKGKEAFLKEMGRILKETGVGAVIHILKNSNPRYRLRGILPKKTKEFCKKAGFKKVSIYSNESLWNYLNFNDHVNLDESDSNRVIEKCNAYNFFVSKRRYEKNLLRLGQGQHKLLKNTEIFYGWEPELRDSLRLKSILKRYDEFIFISPHLDDAVLSCGVLLWELKYLKKDITILTAFTEGGLRPYSPQAKKFLKKCGYINALKLFEDRKKEDKDAVRFYKGRFIHLGFVDAAWRKDEKERNIYGSEKIQFSGKIAKRDRGFIAKIAQEISSLIPKGKHTIVFAPLGVGNHVDHIIIREAICRLITPTIFWEDFPYNTNKNSVERFFSQNKILRLSFELDAEDFSTKESAIKIYKSQLKLLFAGDKIPKLPERYYFNEIADSAK